MRFVRYWIEQARETPEERTAKLRKHAEIVSEGADKMKDRWAKYERNANGYWTFKRHTSNTRHRLAEAQVSPISFYAQALDDMDMNERREQLASTSSKK